MVRPTPRLLGLAVGVAMTFVLLYRNFGGHSAVPRLYSNPPPSVDALIHVSPDMQKGNAVMGHIGNETVKAELGRAAWKLFHTTMAQFPDQPSAEESAALKSYIYLFARLYPCGECAAHFQTILQEYPPQTSSRSAAASWGCHVHNEVNKSKGKQIFDCANIGDFYDCGCGDEDGKQGSEFGQGKLPDSAKTNMVQGAEKVNLEDFKPGQIAKEGITNGG